jgi:hypothetical protein
VDTLKFLRLHIQEEGFNADGLALLDLIYEKMPGAQGLVLQGAFNPNRKVQEVSNRDPPRLIYELECVTLLDPEIGFYEELTKLTQERVEPPSGPMMDPQLLPGQEDFEKIMRYEGHLERQFERKLKQLVVWRQVNGQGCDEEAMQPRLTGRRGDGDDAM